MDKCSQHLARHVVIILKYVCNSVTGYLYKYAYGSTHLCTYIALVGLMAGRQAGRKIQIFTTSKGAVLLQRFKCILASFPSSKVVVFLIL